ncbi:MAG: GTPase ObgE [Elusimicrobiota bacterium]
MFTDKAKLYVQSGSGGNGCVSFRREKFIPKGGPNGGNGGNGGNVYFRANHSIKTLRDFYYRPHYKAESGKQGSGNNKTGESGEDLYIEVPCGTVIYRDGDVVVDMFEHNQTVLIATGGRGGRGNTAFKSNTNRVPRLSEKGTPGESVTLELELRVIADISIVGYPNAGKSTFISVITGARPKIADYPFTTLEPVLGSCQIGDTNLIFVDVPGLIEDAHAGRGLGHEFLRHIRRTRVIVHMVDVWGYGTKTAAENYKIIMDELEKYDRVLLKKPILTVLNKTDIPGSEEMIKSFKKSVGRKVKFHTISAIKKDGLTAFLKEVKKAYIVAPEEVPLMPTVKSEVYHKLIPGIMVEYTGGKFVVKGSEVKRLVAITNFDQRQSVKRLFELLTTKGMERLFKKNGITPGDIVSIEGHEYEYTEEEDSKHKK